MKFIMEINIGNDAVQTGSQIIALVREAADKMEKKGEPSCVILDENGNRVGYANVVR